MKRNIDIPTVDMKIQSIPVTGKPIKLKFRSEGWTTMSNNSIVEEAINEDDLKLLEGLSEK